MYHSARLKKFSPLSPSRQQYRRVLVAKVNGVLYDYPYDALGSVPNNPINLGQILVSFPQLERRHVDSREKSGKVLIVGLDGGCFDLLGPWMEEGRLPVLKSLVQEGVSTPLRSVFPPTTAPAWASFATGKNPGKHGIFDLTMRDCKTLSSFPASSSVLQSETLWEIVSRFGCSVVVAGIPVSYPPRPVNGILISDFLMPKGTQNVTFPPDLLSRLEEKFGPFRIHHTQVYYPGNVSAVVQEAHEILAYQSQMFCDLIANHSWDLAALHIFGTDRLQHELWHILDETHPDHHVGEASAHKAEVIGFFEAVDRELGKIIHLAGPEVSIVVMSDHGFGPIRNYLVFNNWLLEKGFLSIKKTVWARIKYALFRSGFTPDACYRLLMKFGFAHLRHSRGIGTRYQIFRTLDYLFLSLKDVEWHKTLAYSKGNFGQIYLNVKGREPYGIVTPGREYETTRDRIMTALSQMKNPETNESLFSDIYRGEEIYEGDQNELAPDIFVMPKDMSFKALGTMDFITNRFIQKSYGQSGDHRLDGMLILRGNAFRQGITLEGSMPKIYDVMPTLLYLMNLPIPEDLDGRVILDAFTDPFQKTYGISFTPSKPGDRASSISPEEEEIMRDNLIRLGYLG